MLSINTNVASLTSQRNLSGSQNALSTSLERLSSGLRINSAKDDAAGLAISERMSGQIRGLDQAKRNANDGISLAQTAEGSLSEISNNLQRIRELSVQAANDTNSASDRAALQQEVSQLTQEITRVAGNTQFNGKNLLDGTFTSQQFQVGANANQTISVSLNNAKADSLGSNTYVSAGTINNATTVNAGDGARNVNNVAAQTLTVSGGGSYTAKDVTVGVNATAKDIAAAVNAETATTGVTAEARTQATLGALNTAGTVSFDLYGSNSSAVTISTTVANKDDLTTLATSINDKSGTTGITAELSSDKKSLTLKSANGDDISIENFDHSGGAGTETMSFRGQDAFDSITPNAGAAQTLTQGGNNSSTVGGSVRFSSDATFSVQSTSATTLLDAATKSSTLQAVSSIDVGTASGANDAISVIDGALQAINSQRASLGAYQNRFNSTITNLQTTSENLNASRSRIRDADFASETATLSRNQILQQAGTAMLAQANQLPQQVLSLLR